MTDVEVTSVAQPTEAQTPVTAEDAIDFCIRQLRRAPDIIKERFKAYNALKHALDIKMAQVADATEGTELAKKRAATIACISERQAMDSAHEAYKYAQARARALEKELSGLQSVNKSVTNSYNTSGWRS
jgi:hypothetical protein